MKLKDALKQTIQEWKKNQGRNVLKSLFAAGIIFGPETILIILAFKLLPKVWAALSLLPIMAFVIVWVMFWLDVITKMGFD